MVSSRFRPERRSRRTLVVLVLASVTALTLDARGSSFVEGLRGDVTELLSPVTSASGRLFDPVENVWNGVFRYGDLKDENQRLRQELEQYKGREEVVAAKEAQWKQYFELLDLPWAADIASVAANVVGAGPSNFDQTVHVDRGAADGVKAGYPVVTGDGLVGRIISVTDHSSAVRLLTDPAFTAGVAVGNDTTALARGEGPAQDLTVELVQKQKTSTGAEDATATVSKGTVIITSGQDVSLFPKDIPVGVVSVVNSAPDAGTLTVSVTPFVDADHLSVVKILRWDPAPVRP